MNSDLHRPTMTHKNLSSKRKGEAGFTLAEALIATLILMFGLASIFNLMVVATSSNSVANRSTGAVMIATEQMEVLRSTPFTQLVDSTGDTLAVQTPGYFQVTNVDGVGTFETRWFIQTLTGPNLKFIRVQTEPGGFRGRAARADFTSIRACTAGTAAGCL